MKNILDIAKKINLQKSDLYFYGDEIAKVKIFDKNGNFNMKNRKNYDFSCENSNLILVTAINPTKSGEGKTTVSIGIADSLKKLNQNVCLCLREPSLGPVFGVKGGACGGGKAKIEPEEKINLHFTGDFHAITSANNLLCSIIDNHIYFGNELKIKTVYFHRCIDLNERELREVTLKNGRKENFVITPASEIMAIMSLSSDLNDLKRRLGNIIIGKSENNELIFAKDLHAENAMFKLLKDALLPNLVQTLHNTPTFVHMGPFANIAHGTNSIVSTKTALSLCDFVVTEAGFGSDLGAEKFFDIVCPKGNFMPKVVVIVATIKALYNHGDGDLSLGISNLDKHIDNMSKVFGVKTLVAINKFDGDNTEDLEMVKKHVKKKKIDCAIVTAFEDGENGSLDLANLVLDYIKNNKKATKKAPKSLKKESLYENSVYKLSDSTEIKIEKIAKKIYGASGVIFSEEAKKNLKSIKDFGYVSLPVVIAKTQYSLSDNKDLKAIPKNFKITITALEIKGGAEFIVAISNDIMLLPALAKQSAYLNM